MTIINVITIIDVETGDPFDRPTGTDGNEDMPAEPSTWTVTVTATVADLGGSTDSTTTVEFTGTFVVDDAGGIAGSASGSVVFDGNCFSNGTRIGNYDLAGSVDVLITGQASGDEGSRTYALTFSQAGASTDSVDDPTGACGGEAGELGAFVSGAFAGADVAAQDGETAYTAGDGFTGTVTLTGAG